MKPTININLAGYPFTIDDDAYRMLKDYLYTIRYAFDTQEDTEDLATDIESRIAEILLEKNGGNTRIVTIDEISKVIERIGKPSDFIEIEETINNKEGKSTEEVKLKEERLSPPPYEPNRNFNGPFRKKLYRDPQNSMLGGVCAGLSYYLNIDVTIVRLLTVILFFLSATTVGIAYVVLWIVVPEAVTPLQKMQMLGLEPTMENIGKNVTENHLQEDNKPEGNETQSGFQKFLSSALSIFVKCLIFIGLLIGLPLLIAVGAAILGCIIAIFVISIGIVGGGMFDSVNEGLMVLYILLAVIGGAITLGIPLWLLIRMAFKKDNKNINPNNRRSILIIWLIGIALSAVFSVKAVKKGRSLDRGKWDINIENLQMLNDLDSEEIEEIKINNGEIIVKTDEGVKYKINKGIVDVEVDVKNPSSDHKDNEKATEDSIIVIDNRSEIIEAIKDSIN